MVANTLDCISVRITSLFFPSRFDLIFLVLDPQDEQFDRRLATHLVSLYHQTKDQEETLYMVGLLLGVVSNGADFVSRCCFSLKGHGHSEGLHCLCTHLHPSFSLRRGRASACAGLCRLVAQSWLVPLAVLICTLHPPQTCARLGVIVEP